MHKIIQTPEHLVYPNYPLRRLVADQEYLECCNDTLPDGPWSVAQNSDSLMPTDDEVKVFKSQGIKVDEYGRPLHPELLRLISDENTGVVTGRGYFYKWGPNYTADAVVVAHDSDEPEVALIKRGDTGQWAFIGGFTDGAETAVQTASREAKEESGLILDVYDSEGIIYEGIPLADRRNTAHAWICTRAVLWNLMAKVPLNAGDDASGAQWVKISQLDSVITPTHRMIAEALKKQL